MFDAQRILVVGVTGSGKTTVARLLATRLGLPHVELDELFWGPAWVRRSTDDFRSGVANATAGRRWVACGNYWHQLQDLTWGQADVIVWLDLPAHTSLINLVTRTLRRVAGRTALWHGNRETLRNVFFSRESLLRWWWTVQKMEPERTGSRVSQMTQAQVVRLKSRREVNRWLSQVHR